MYKINLGSSNFKVPTMAVGCMRINGTDKKNAEIFLRTAIEHGANFFDHADIYGRGECEEIFSDVLNMGNGIREKIILQTKCGIVPGKMYDFSKEHIINSVEKSLKRLKTDYVNVLLLHRPDALCEPEEVAEAFSELKKSGKVLHFGVSNHNPMQIELLKKYLDVPIVANQLQLSITNCTMISNSMNVNMENYSSTMRDGSVLDYSRLNDITIQPWSPFQYGFFEGVFIDSDKFPELNKTLSEISEKYNVTKTTVAFSWLLRHPAKFQPVTGTMNVERLKDCIKATEIKLTREEWYDIYKSAGNTLP